EPGVDVMTPVGAPLWAPGAGTILAVQTSPAGATGRYVTLITDEGDWFRFLHNSSVVVSAGQKVEQAQLLAYTGGSGFGSEAYYGPHTHISFKVGYTGAFPGAAALDDFEAYMADAGRPLPRRRAMARVTGNIKNFGLSAVDGYELRLRFVPSNGAVGNDTIVTPGDIQEVAPGPDGSFAITLAATVH